MRLRQSDVEVVNVAMARPMWDVSFFARFTTSLGISRQFTIADRPVFTSSGSTMALGSFPPHHISCRSKV
jgi:hypothetical protein